MDDFFAYEKGLADYKHNQPKPENPFDDICQMGAWERGYTHAKYRAENAEIDALLIEKEEAARKEHDEWLASLVPEPENWEEYDPTEDSESCHHDWEEEPVQEDEGGVFFIRKCCKCESRDINWIQHYFVPDY